MPNNRRLKILLSAYSCEPGFSSERGVGWNWAVQLAKYHKVWVLTRETNRTAIEKELKNDQYHGLHFVYFDYPIWFRFWKKAERGLYLYYLCWQLASVFIVHALNRTVKFEVIHYLTFGSVMLPNFFFMMPSKIVLGPIGGGGNAPLVFLKEFSLKGKLSELLRHFVQLIHRINPLLWLTFARADKILLRDKETLRLVPARYRNRCTYFLETGVPPELIAYTAKENKSPQRELTLVTVGRFIHSKINVLTVKIIKEFKKKYHLPFKLYMIGEGHETGRIVKFIKQSEIGEQIILTGWLHRQQVFTILAESDIFIFTSFKEGGSWAIFEAMMMQLPIVCLDVGGPSLLVCDDCGIRVKVSRPSAVIDEFSDAILRLAKERELRNFMGIKSKAHLIADYTWAKMGLRMNKIYAEIFS